MRPDEFARYTRLVAQARREHPDWRIGQTCFNVLYQIRPDLADEIRGTRYDPFNDDERYGAFVEWLTNGRLT